MTETAKGNIKAIGFDAFTIFDPFSVDAVIEENFPGKGTQLANAWRTRIFEYCWQRTLNQTYVDFWQVLDDALTFAFKAAKAELKPDVRAKLMDAFLQLKPWPDSVEALQSMRKAGIRLAYVSNLTRRATNCSAPLVWAARPVAGLMRTLPRRDWTKLPAVCAREMNAAAMCTIHLS
jgi:2-haloacid dehalogenase